MKTKKFFLPLAFLFLSFSAMAQENSPKVEKAVVAAEAWLKLVDAESYGDSWEQAAPIFKGAITRDQWIQAMKSMRQPMGKPGTRELKSSTYHTSLPGAPAGEYVVIVYATPFPDGTTKTETITPALDPEGTWRVSGYYIQ